MEVLGTKIDPRSEEYQENRAAMEAKLAEFEALMEQARQGGGEKYIQRHRDRGKLLARERIELLVDQDSPFLELSTLAAWGTDKRLGANVVTGIGVVEGVECAILAHDPTSQAGSMNRYSVAKTLRIMDIARENRLPLINLVESGGADLPDQAEVFIVGGKWFRNLTQLSKMGIPTMAIVFGSSTAGGAYFPALCDYAVMVKERAKVFLGGPPLVKMATGEESTDEELGGAEMHSKVSGLSDYFAQDEHEAIRMGRDIVSHFNWRKQGYGPTKDPDEPIHDVDDLLGVIPTDLRVPFDMREILGRTVDGSRFEEYKAVYGTSILTGWASIHGFQIGVVANQQGVIFSEEANKATEFIQLCNRYDTPIIFIHNTTGYMVGKDYEQRGIIKDGAKMVNAVANSEVPHITLMAGVSYGAGNYGMSGRSYDPRFVFGYPTHKVAVMGPKQLAGVMSIIARQGAEARGEEFDEKADEARRTAIEAQIEEEEQAYFSTARVRDDGLIDPRDTRHVLGIALSATHSGPVEGTDRFGVFRM
jgi:acetyl-CoA carboxylase carboxyltransferase component